MGLDPSVGTEANKTRPAAVVSNDAANATASRLGRGVVLIVPLTSAVDRVLPFQVLVSAGTGGLRQDSKAQAEQVRSVDVRRIERTLGTLPPATMAEIDEALRLHLAL